MHKPAAEFEVIEAHFVTSAPTFKLCQDQIKDLPEIAFIGRSNVGKSSLIGELLRKKHLVKTSKRPGHTTAVNFFEVLLQSPKKERKAFMLADLPGYGFAQINLQEKARMGVLISEYLRKRQQLRAVCHLLDIRHKPTKDDQQMSTLLSDKAYHHFPIATKADKIVKSKRKNCKLLIAKNMEMLPNLITLFSISEHLGREVLWQKIWDILPEASR